MRLKLSTFILGLLLLSGCMSLPKNKDWTHPQVANPRKEDQLFVEDTKFCEDKIGPMQPGPAHDSAMADCLTRLGWKRVERD
jgi:hypothetical protein